MQGHKDSELTELGRQQALQLRIRFRDVHFDRVLSSDSPRAIGTARLIIGDSPLEIVTTPALRERNYGPYEGKHITQYQTELRGLFETQNALPPEKKWSFRLAPGIETTEEIVNRFLAFINEAAQKYARETILVVSHGSIIKHSVARLGMAEFHDPHPVIKNGSYIKVVHDGSRFSIGEIVGVKDPGE